jgi:hypothetical protein
MNLPVLLKHPVRAQLRSQIPPLDCCARRDFDNDKVTCSSVSPPCTTASHPFCQNTSGSRHPWIVSGRGRRELLAWLAPTTPGAAVNILCQQIFGGYQAAGGS